MTARLLGMTPRTEVDVPPRRRFLRTIAGLPLLGGSIALLGQPTAVAAPVTPDLLETYKTFLRFELRYLAWEMAGNSACLERYGFDPQHGDRVAQSKTIRDITFGEYDRGVSEGSAPSTRAALVLSAVGCDWREGGR